MFRMTPTGRLPTFSSASSERAAWSRVVFDCAVHEQGRVGDRRDLRAVGHRQQRRRVDDDEVDLLGDVVDDLLGVLADQQFARVRRDRAAGEDGEVLAGVLQHRLDRRLADDDRGEADVADQAERLRDRRTAQVGLDEAHPRAGLGERGGEVDRGGRLALAGHGAGDRDDARRVVDVDELQVGTQLAVGLGARTVRVAAEGDRRARRALVERDLGQQRDAEFLEVRALLTVLSRISRTTATPMPMNRPSTRPRPMFRILLGLIGIGATVAGLIVVSLTAGWNVVDPSVDDGAPAAPRVGTTASKALARAFASAAAMVGSVSVTCRLMSALFNGASALTLDFEVVDRQLDVRRSSASTGRPCWPASGPSTWGSSANSM